MGAGTLIGSINSLERIQGLSALKPVSLLKTFVAGRGYSLWPEDLALVGNMQLVEASLLAPDLGELSVTYAITALNPNLALLALRLHWPQQTCASAQLDLHFWHAIVCNAPRSEANILALSDLGLSLLSYYESHYTEVGQTLAQIAGVPLIQNITSWSEAFFRLPQQVPSCLNSQTRTMLTDVRALMPDVPKVTQPHPPPQQALQCVAALGWMMALLLLVVLVLVLRR